ncbi:hypothetical protein D3C75_1184270 [compost metagenome]
MSAGVPAGAARPNHVTASKPGKPRSAMVGTSGMSGARCEDVTASARILPLRTWPISVGTDDRYMSICPPIRSLEACAAPLYGT